MNAGGYGTVTISKPINIVAEGVEARSSRSDHRHRYQCRPNDVVSLQGLSFITNQNQPGVAAIRVMAAGAVHISIVRSADLRAGSASKRRRRAKFSCRIARSLPTQRRGGEQCPARNLSRPRPVRTQPKRHRQQSEYHHLPSQRCVLADNAVAIDHIAGGPVAKNNQLQPPARPTGRTRLIGCACACRLSAAASRRRRPAAQCRCRRRRCRASCGCA